MSFVHDMSCGCRPPAHPRAAANPAGLAASTRASPRAFPNIARPCCRRSAAQTGAGRLARATATRDLGVMLLEAWAYVLDITGFYDARVAERAYHRHRAGSDGGAATSSALLGYRPRGGDGCAG